MECCPVRFNQRFLDAVEKQNKNEFQDYSSNSDSDENQNYLVKSSTVDQVKQFRSAGEYLQVLKYPKVIASDRKSIEKLILINKILYDESIKKNLEIVDAFCKTELDIIFVDIINSYFTSIKDYLLNPGQNVLHKRKYLIVALIFDILWKMTDYSQTIRVRFHRQQGTKALLDYIVDEEFAQNLKLISGHDHSGEDDSMKDINILRSLCGCLHNVSKICDNYKFDFNQLQVSSILFKYLKQNPTQLISIYLTIANVVNDKEIETIVEIKTIVKEIVKLIKLISASIFTNFNLKRTKIDYMNKYSDYVAVVEYNDTQWNLIELIEGLYRFSINDSIKYYIYEEMKFKEDSEKILSNGNETENFFATKLLWQLCFDQRIANSLVSNDKKLYSLIVSLSQKKHQYGLELNKNCLNILWSVKKFASTSSVKSSKSSLNRTPSSVSDYVDSVFVPQTDIKEKLGIKDELKTVMISYHNENQELCLKLKNEFKTRGYNVIIDVNEIYGSTLQWMANAIETCDFLIICATEKYKQSSNCRAEAEYAFKLKKTIIPCILQSNYNPDGWLGIIFGSKIYINFAEKSYDEAINALIKEINFNEKNRGIESETLTNIQLSTNKSNGIIFKSNINEQAVNCRLSTWPADKVNKWLSEKKFDYRIKRQFQNCNGETLMKFYKTKLEAPEYFYSTISKNGSIEVNRVFEFIDELESFFNK